MEHAQSGTGVGNSDKLAWGILGTGEIARTFAKGLAGSRTGRLVAVGSRSRESAEKFGERVQRRPPPRLLRGAAGRPGGAGGVHLDAAPHARRVGDPGGGGGEAHPVREADRRELRRGDGDRRGGPAARRLPHGSVHVPLPPADAAARRADPRRGDRRGAAHPGDVQLPLADPLQPREPPAGQRPGRRRHPRRRRLPGVDGPAHRRRGGGQGLRRPDRGDRLGPPRPDRRGRVGRRVAQVPRRRPRATHDRRAGQCRERRPRLRLGGMAARPGALAPRARGAARRRSSSTAGARRSRAR